MINLNKKPIIILLISVLVLAVFSGYLSYSAVDDSLTPEDSRYSSLFLKNVPPLPENPSYDDELMFIHSVQRSILGISPQTGFIPGYSEREPKDLYIAKVGYCYDRSRTIEKILRLHGFKVRHIFIVSTNKTGSTL